MRKKITHTLLLIILTIGIANGQIKGTTSMVEVAREALPQHLQGEDKLIAINRMGDTIAVQITFDNKVIFPILNEKGHSFYIEKGYRKFDTLVCGAHYPERLDDIAWENNLTAYRTYGPALQKSGERAFGYDVWTKRKPSPIVKERYYNHLHNNISYHIDHGNGMDVYAVGASLGCGTAALLIGSEILYPYCWSEYRILDNGPWRFTVELKYVPFELEGAMVQEVRTISLDYGTYLNKTSVRFTGLQSTQKIAAGAVVHNSNPESYTFDTKGIIMVEDSTQSSGNGAIYVGIVRPEGFQNCHYKSYNRQGDIAGHILGEASIAPGEEFVYYWGASWSKNNISYKMWHNYLQEQISQKRKIRNVKINFK